MKITYDHVIWDFNGTVLDDVAIGIESINQMLAARGLPVLPDVESYRAVFDFPVEDYYRRVGFDFGKEDFKTVLAPEWVALYEKASSRAMLYAGVEPLNRFLRRCGVAQSILSASHTGMIREQLAAQGAQGWFDEIWGTDSILAHGKGGLADAWRTAHSAARALLLGDTTHDFEVARRMGADCILVAAGHHSREKLQACGVPVFSDLLECAAFLGLSE